MHIAYAAAGGLTLFATLQRLSDGFYWDATAGVWGASPAAADRKIPLAEGAGAEVGSYSAQTLGLGDAGLVRLRVHDDGDPSDGTLAVSQVWIAQGSEVFPGMLARGACPAFVDDPTPTASGFVGSTELTPADDKYNGAFLVFTSGANRGLARRILDYVGATRRLAAFDQPFPAAPADGDSFEITGWGGAA